MVHSKRAYLTTEDINSALRLRNVEVGASWNMPGPPHSLLRSGAATATAPCQRPGGRAGQPPTRTPTHNWERYQAGAAAVGCKQLQHETQKARL